MSNNFPISFLRITEENEKQRIDNFLKKKFKKTPKSIIYKILRTGQVRINKMRVKPKYKLKIGDHIRIPPLKKTYQIKKGIPPNSKLYSLLSDNILYEDDYLLVLNKPSGLAVHSGSGIKFGVIEYLRILKNINTYFDLVHRLDRETSGVLIIAKKRSVLRDLHKQLRERKIIKKYLALVHGQWPKHLTCISAPLLKVISKYDHVVTINHIHGKTSKTFFKIQEIYDNNTLMLITPKTGRTHQIRAHAKYANHPIVLDKKYGKANLDNIINNNLSINRILLHSTSVNFFHPIKQEFINVIAPLDIAFKKVLNDLKKNVSNTRNIIKTL